MLLFSLLVGGLDSKMRTGLEELKIFNTKQIKSCHLTANRTFKHTRRKFPTSTRRILRKAKETSQKAAGVDWIFLTEADEEVETPVSRWEWVGPADWGWLAQVLILNQAGASLQACVHSSVAVWKFYSNLPNVSWDILLTDTPTYQHRQAITWLTSWHHNTKF